MTMKTKRLNQDLLRAIKQGNLNDAQRLLAEGANANARDSRNLSALYIALFKFENKEIVELLLQKGANPDSRVGEFEGSLLFAAIAACDDEIKKFFDEHDEHASSRYADPLDRVSILLKYGADPYFQNADGVNAFMIAEEIMGQDLVDFLGTGMADRQTVALEVAAQVLTEKPSRQRVRL